MALLNILYVPLFLQFYKSMYFLNITMIYVLREK
jgi:hypothetical protein